MTIRNAVLIVDKKGDTSGQTSEELRKQGRYSITVEHLGTVIPLIESRDRIYTIVLVDQGLSLDDLIEDIKILKQLGPGVPIVVSTAENSPQKEIEVRKAGISFYHLKDDGMEELIKAVISAMDHAVMKGNFIPGLGSYE
jgi:DNA-binding response OmpR family regulator